MESPYPQSWMDRVGVFATAVGVEIEKINEALEPMVGKPSDEAVVILGDASAVSDAEIKEALKGFGIPTGKLNINLVKLRPEKAVVEVAAPTEKATSPMTTLSILPSVPTEDSFLEMLRIGGVLKVGIPEVIAAIKAGFGNQIGLYGIIEKMSTKMEDFSVSQGELCGSEFYEMQKFLTERQYGDILSAMGVPGKYVNETRKKSFLTKLNAKLWPALNDFQNQLTAWQQAWMQGMSNPGMIMMAMTAQQVGGALPPGMMQPPVTTPLRAAGEDVVNEINLIFAGTGVPVARALAYDATRIMKILDNKELPSKMGATNKDQMLKELGIGVGSSIVQMEQSLTRYAMAIMKLPEVTPDNELAYFAAMIQLGATIPWDKIGAKGLGSKDLRN